MLARFLNRWRLRRLIRGWTAYRDLIVAEGRSAHVSREQENGFLRMQARLIADIGRLESALPLLRAPASPHGFARLREFLQSRTALTGALEAPASPESFQRDWHEGFLFLNELRGTRLHSGRPARTRAFSVPTGRPHRGRIRPPAAWFFGFVARVGVLGLAVYLVGRALGLPGSAARFSLNGRSGASLADSVIGGLQSLWRGAVEFMAPVVSSYGPEATLAMLVVLALGVGYWIFIRG